MARFTKEEIDKTRKYLSGLYENRGRYISIEEAEEYLICVSVLKD